MQHKTNITKRLLSVLLALIVVVGLLPAQPALAANMIDCYWRGAKFTNSSGAVLADEDGYYLADGISSVDWTFEAEKEHAYGYVFASHLSVSEYSENPRAYLFANEGCTVPFQTVPVSGNTYYVRFQCLIHTSDENITLYQRLNDSNTTLAIPGCTTTFVNSRHIRHWDIKDVENRVTDIYWVYELTFRVTQGYTLEEVTASAAGVSMDTTGKVRLKEYQYDLTWKAGYAPSYVGYVYPYLHTDPECTQTLSKMPEPDGKYYVPLTFYNTQANDTTINFNLISQATLNIPDFSVSKKSIRTFRYLSQDRVEIIFEVQRDPYVIEKVEANAKELKKDSKGTYYFSNCLATLTWKDGNSSSYQFNGVAYLYRDEECLNNPFYMELRPNESGYASLVIRNAVAGNHGIDFRQISPDSTLSLLPGYTATFVKSVPYRDLDGTDAVSVIFRVTRGDKYILRRIDATSTGVKKHSDGTPYLDGLSYTFTWKDNKSPALFGDDYGAPMFYTDANCTNQVTTDLTVETNYYVPLTFYNPVEYDHSIVFDQISSASTLTIPGCFAAFYKIIPFVDSEHCDSVKVVFQVTKLPPPAAEYVLEKYEMTAEGVEGGYGSSYSLKGEVETLTWKNGKVTSNIMTNGNVNLYTDEACTNSLETRPALGQSCYARIILCNKTNNDHSIDFSQISSATLTIPLYDVILHSVERYEETNNRDAVRITFKLIKQPYTLEKITPTATGVAQRNGDYYLSGYSTTLEWKDDLAPPGDFWPLDDDNYLYIDENCDTRLTTEPEAGKSYYVRCGVWHWNNTEYDYSIDMDRISETTTLTIPGYSVAFHKVGLYENEYSDRLEHFIIFKVSFHALERIDVTATGVNYYGGGINALDGCRVKYTWANGGLPFGFSSNSESYLGDVLCIDEDCTTSLEGEARDGETYYWSFVTGARVDNDHSINFSKISPDSTLTVPGYIATFHKSETYVSTYANCSMVRVIFKLTKDGGTPGDVTYTVTFKDGENVISTATVNSGEKVAKPVDPSKSGYSFDGWYEDPTFNIVFDFDQPITANASVYAKFSPITAPVTYDITVNVGANGTASASAASATAGTAITITATPNSGYEIDKITWTPEGGSATDITSSRSFTMPAAKVTVDVSFKASSVTPPGPVTVPEVKQQGTEESVQQPTKEEKAVISMNAGLKISQTGSKINIKWGKVGEADGYDVYVAYCNKKFGKAVKTINKNSTTSVTVKKINGKKINLKKNFKVYVAAYKMTDGKKEVLAKSIMGHVVGRLNTRYSNVRKITLSKSKYSVKVGKTVKVKAKTVLVDKSKKQLSNAHAAQFRYASSNRNIATVDKNGKVKGVAKGTCTIYVYARNGYAKTVKVTVK